MINFKKNWKIKHFEDWANIFKLFKLQIYEFSTYVVFKLQFFKFLDYIIKLYLHFICRASNLVKFFLTPVLLSLHAFIKMIVLQLNFMNYSCNRVCWVCDLSSSYLQANCKKKLKFTPKTQNTEIWYAFLGLNYLDPNIFYWN